MDISGKAAGLVCNEHNWVKKLQLMVSLCDKTHREMQNLVKQVRTHGALIDKHQKISKYFFFKEEKKNITFVLPIRQQYCLVLILVFDIGKSQWIA